MNYQFKELETERMLLKNIDDSHLMDLHELRSDPILMKFIARPISNVIGDTEALLRKVKTANSNNENINWAMTLKGDSEMFGFIGFAKVTKEHHRAEIGYMMKSSHHGKGYVNEALLSIIQFAFDEMGLHSLEAIIDPANSASENVLLKLGFKKEAHFKDNIFFEGNYLDSVHYCLLVSDWQMKQ